MGDRRAKRARADPVAAAREVEFDDHASDGDQEAVWYRGSRVDLSRMHPAERRRFKNRMSAAKSRNRKKAQVSMLEDRLRDEESENRRLRAQVDELRAQLGELRAHHARCGRASARGVDPDGYASDPASARSPASSVGSRSPQTGPGALLPAAGFAGVGDGGDNPLGMGLRAQGHDSGLRSASPPASASASTCPSSSASSADSFAPPACIRAAPASVWSGRSA